MRPKKGDDSEDAATAAEKRRERREEAVARSQVNAARALVQLAEVASRFVSVGISLFFRRLIATNSPLRGRKGWGASSSRIYWRSTTPAMKRRRSSEFPVNSSLFSW